MNKTHIKLLQALHEATEKAPEVVQHPQKIGRYEVQIHLADDQFYRFYRAFDPKVQRHVTIQVPKFTECYEEIDIDAIRQQARSTARITSSNIARIYHVGKCDRYPIYVVMPDYPRGTLKGLIENLHLSKLPIAYCVQLCIQIASPLHKAHQQGIVHSNIKPVNILLDGRQSPHLTGFCFADARTQKVLWRHITPGELFYLAPEQIDDDECTLDQRTDIWALGVLLYELLTGKLPFRSDISAELFREIQNHTAVRPKKIDRRIPDSLEQVILKCLSKNPDHRYQSVLELSNDLNAWLNSERKSEQAKLEARLSN